MWPKVWVIVMELVTTHGEADCHYVITPIIGQTQINVPDIAPIITETLLSKMKYHLKMPYYNHVL